MKIRAFQSVHLYVRYYHHVVMHNSEFQHCERHATLTRKSAKNAPIMRNDLAGFGQIISGRVAKILGFALSGDALNWKICRMLIVS